MYTKLLIGLIQIRENGIACKVHVAFFFFPFFFFNQKAAAKQCLLQEKPSQHAIKLLLLCK